MRNLYLFLCLAPLLTGCLTMSTFESARYDKKPEKVKAVLSSYKDTSGNTVVIYTKGRKQHTYKAVVPLDSILYKSHRRLDTNYTDRSIPNFNGLFNISQSAFGTNVYRLVIFDRETKLPENANIGEALRKDQGLVTLPKGKIRMPVYGPNPFEPRTKKVRPVSFIVKDTNDNGPYVAQTTDYYITFAPKRRRITRYFWIPLTIGVDMLSLSLQLAMMR